MFTQPNTTQPTATRGTTREELFRTIERNNGRLQVLRYATYGLEHVTGNEASCFGWIIDDIQNDLESLGNQVEHAINPSQNSSEEEGDGEIP